MSPDWLRPIPVRDAQALEVVAVDLDRVPATLAAAGLSPEEAARARRFHRSIDQHRYRAAHSALRVVLARRLGQHPLELRFDVGPQGKPALAGTPPPLHFNLSHSHGRALIALCADHEVGVDLELPASLAADTVTTLSPVVASPAERAHLAQLDTSNALAAFLGLWTGKEAVLKALGLGLGSDATRIHIGPSRADRRAIVLSDEVIALSSTTVPHVDLWAIELDGGAIGHVARRPRAARAMH